MKIISLASPRLLRGTLYVILVCNLQSYQPAIGCTQQHYYEHHHVARVSYRSSRCSSEASPIPDARAAVLIAIFNRHFAIPEKDTFRFVSQAYMGPHRVDNYIAPDTRNNSLTSAYHVTFTCRAKFTTAGEAALVERAPLTS